MRIPFRKRRVETRASYSDAVTELLLRQASGSDASATQTAAVETAIGLISRCFGAARLDPPVAAVTPNVMMDFGRQVLTSGNAVAAIEVDSRGLSLLPVSGWDVTGGPTEASWYYHLTLPGPSRLETRVLPSTDVLHYRVGQDRHQPHIGISPLARAGFSSTLLSRLEKRMSEEASAEVGSFLVHRDLTPEQADQLKVDLGNLKGENVLVKGIGSQAFDTRGQPGGGDSWTPKRVGASIPESNIEARREAGQDVAAALGIPRSLLAGTNAMASAEGYRQLLTSTLIPLGDVLAQEISTKMAVPGLTIRWDRTAASDVARRATAYQRLRDAELPAEQAARISQVE